MPIRTRRGRVAAYRALWEWPLRSPLRLAATVAALVTVVVAVSVLAGSGTGGGGRTATGALAPAPTAVPGDPGDPSDAPDPSAAASPPPPELTPARLPLSAAPSAALAVAGRWTEAWATHPPGTTPAQWSERLRPFTTDEYLPTLAEVDPANVPGTRVTGPPVAVDVRGEAVRAQVPTDAVRLELLLVQVAPGDWRVSGYDRAS